MTYRRIISTMGCPEFTLGEAATLAQGHGLDGIELRSLGGTIDLPTYLAATYGSIGNLAAQLPAVPVVALCTSLKLVGATREERAAFLQVVPWAEALGARWLRVFDAAAGSSEADLATAADTVQWWHEQRARHGWQADIMVETHDSLLTAGAVQRFLAVCPGTAIRWDSHHTWKKGGEDPLVTWRGIKAAVVSIDVKDSINRPSAKHAWTYVLPGDGEFPMAPLRAVIGAEFAGAVSLEWEKLWHPSLPSLDEALAAAEKKRWW